MSERSVWEAVSRVSSWPFIVAIRLYQVTLGPMMGGQCRFVPTCSRYAIEAYQEHGPIVGTWLTLRRVLRCHPLGGSGYDPVPINERREQAKKSKQKSRSAEDK